MKTMKVMMSVAVLMLGLAAMPAFAATTVTTSMGVSATVQSACIVSANPLAFGAYTVSASNVDVQTTISVTCTNTTTYNVGMNAGTATGATVTTRKMTGPSSALLAYAIYSDSGRTTNWGNTVGTDTLAGTGSGAAQTINVYGRIAGGLYVTPGSYADTVTVSVTY